MDYRAVAELVWFALLGLSIFTAVAGLSVRLFLAPVIREVMERLGSRRQQDVERIVAELERLDGRLSALETDVHRLEAGERFDRALGSGDDDER